MGSINTEYAQLMQQTAIAEGRIEISASLLAKIDAGEEGFGEWLSHARQAALEGARQTAHLFSEPAYRSFMRVIVGFRFDRKNAAIICTAKAETRGGNGADTEALSAVSAALLALYTHCKETNEALRIAHIRLLDETQHDILAQQTP